MEEASEFKSVFHNSYDDEQALQEAEEEKNIEENIDRELAELSEPDFDDDSDESVHDPLPQHHQGLYHQGAHPVVAQPGGHLGGQVGVIQALPHQQQSFHPNQESTPFNSHYPSRETAGNSNFRNDEELILNAPEGVRNLEVLYNARGVEIERLKKEKDDLVTKLTTEIRQLKHENTILKGNEGRIQLHQEHYQNIADTQSKENQALRLELDDLKAKLFNSEKTVKEKVANNESSDMMIQKLQSDLQAMQKSDTILRAKHQHEETLRSLKERHDNEVFQLQQEIDRLNANAKRDENEKEHLRIRSQKASKDYDILALEKSDTTRDLQERLDLSQKKLANYMAQTSSKGYTNVKAMHDRYEIDKEKFAQDLCTYQEEIQRLKKSLKTKTDDIQAKEKETIQFKSEFQLVLEEKTSTISTLSERLHETETKITQLMRESLSGSTNAAVKRLQDENEKLKFQIDAKNEEIVKLKSSLDEASTKYSSFKSRVKQYKQHKETKEEKYKEHITKSEEDFRTKLIALRDKMQNAYDTKLYEIESEMVGVQRYVQDELTKVGRESPIVPRREVVAPPRAEPVHAQVLGSGNGSDGENQSTDNLTRLLQNAKVDIGQRLKRPTSASTQDRLPLEDIGSNRLQL